MFARFTRLPTRRYLHTSSHSTWQQRSRLVNTTLGVSVVTVTYFAWRLTSDKNRIALDSALPAQAGEQTPSKVNVVNKPKFTLTSVAASDNMETPNVPPTIPESPVPAEADSPSGSDVTENPDEGPEGDAGDSGQGGAYNPVTGEINWDCPCLGGMAHGPCGPQFREAFSCFIFSEEEPKGINCIDKFKNMQTCFREHPELYGDEIMDDDEDQDPLPELEGGVPSPVYASESEESKTREAVDTPPVTQTNTLTVSQAQQDKSLASSS